MKVNYQVDDAVHYIPYEGCSKEHWEKGIITKIVTDEFKIERIYVKYLRKHGNEGVYTQPMLTPRNRLHKGWF